MTPNPAYIQALRDSVKQAPYPNLIGMTIASIEFDRCRIDLDLGEKHLQPFGIVHGGVLATLIDTATFWAGFLRLPEDAGLVNVSRVGNQKHYQANRASPVFTELHGLVIKTFGVADVLRLAYDRSDASGRRLRSVDINATS